MEDTIVKLAKANISHKNENFDAKLGATRVDTDGFSAKSPKVVKQKIMKMMDMRIQQ